MIDFQNLSRLDRIVRLAVGVALLLASWTGWAEGLGGIACGIFGWVPTITGALGWSPIYALFKIDTRRHGR